VDSTLGHGTSFRLDFPVALDLENAAPAIKQALHA